MLTVASTVLRADWRTSLGEENLGTGLSCWLLVYNLGTGLSCWFRTGEEEKTGERIGEEGDILVINYLK